MPKNPQLAAALERITADADHRDYWLNIHMTYAWKRKQRKYVTRRWCAKTFVNNLARAKRYMTMTHGDLLSPLYDLI